MRALFFGLIFIAASMYLVLPFDWAMNWLPHVLPVLKGVTPIALMVMGGLFCLLGIADVRDRAHARKEKNFESSSEFSTEEK